MSEPRLQEVYFDVPLKKAVDALAIVPTKDKITVLARKIYNVMMHETQKQGVEPEIYRMRLKDLVTGLDFNSNNTEILKEHLRQMATTSVEWQSPSKGEGAKWGVSALIAQAEITHEGGDVILEWSYAPNIKQAILDPLRFAKISLTFQAALKTYSGLALYEICCRYVDNPGGTTARQLWTWWRPVLTGVPDDKGEQKGAYAEWKYFNRDIVKLAVAEVNAMTDLQVESIEHKKGRFVADLQFKVSRKAGRSAPGANISGPVDLRNLGRAIKVGIPQDRAEKLIGRHGEARISKGLDDLEARMFNTYLPEVRNPEKFLLALLTSQTSIVTILGTMKSSEVVAKESKAARVALLEKYRERRRGEAWSLFEELPDTEKKDCMVEFEIRTLAKANPAIQKSYQSRGINSPMTKAIFLKFLAENMHGPAWDSPDDSTLLEYSLSA
jgi:hypothetical protein